MNCVSVAIILVLVVVEPPSILLSWLVVDLLVLLLDVSDDNDDGVFAMFFLASPSKNTATPLLQLLRVSFPFAVFATSPSPSSLKFSALFSIFGNDDEGSPFFVAKSLKSDVREERVVDDDDKSKMASPDLSAVCDQTTFSLFEFLQLLLLLLLL